MLLYIILTCLCLAKSEPAAITLNECLRLARLYNPAVIQADKEWEIAQLAFAEGQKQWLPNLSALQIHVPFKKNTEPTGFTNLSWQLPYGTMINFNPSVSFFSKQEIDADIYRFHSRSQRLKHFWWSYSTKFYSQLSVDQTLLGPTGAKSFLQQQDLNVQFRAAALHYYDTVRQALFSTVQCYRQLVNMINQENQTAQSIAQSQRQLKRYDLEYSAGKIAKSVLLEHKAAILQSELNLIKLKTGRKQKEYQLKRLIGKPNHVQLIISSDLPIISPLNIDSKSLVYNAIIHNSQLMQAHAQLKRLSQNVNISKQLSWPQVGLRAEMTTPYNADTGAYKTHFTLGMRMEVPIDNYSNKAQLKTQDIQYQMAVAQFIDQCKDTIHKVNDAYQDINYLYQAIAIIEQRNNLAERNYENAKLKHKNGMISTYELIQQHDQYQSSLHQIVTEKINYLNQLDMFYLQSSYKENLFGLESKKFLRYYFKLNDEQSFSSSTQICNALLATDICEYPINTV